MSELAASRTLPAHTAFPKLQKFMAWITEVPAAALVIAEIVILGGGAVARYAFHAPLTWTDELASILFLWLAMLGA